MKDLANVIFLHKTKKLHKERKDSELMDYSSEHKKIKETIGYSSYYEVPCLYEGCKDES